jgi:hypothetical protein
MNGINHNPLDNRIIATYSSEDKLNQAKTILMTKLGLPESSVSTIKPSDSSLEAKLEGSQKKIGTKLLQTHLKWALIGLGIGMLIATVLVQVGPDVMRNNPLLTYIAFISPSLFIGLFGAGFVGLKPEHDVANLNAVKANNHGYWTLVVKAQSTTISKEDIVEEIKHTQCSEVEQTA